MTYLFDLQALEDEKRTQAQRLKENNLIETPLWDKGFIRVLDWFGTDRDIVRSARVSYGRHMEDRTPEQDKKLIDYLMKNGHTSPFELPQLRIHVKIPIFVARQWVRHRTWSLNEISARYSVLPRDFYVPAREQIQGQASKNKQCSEGELPDDVAYRFLARVGNNSHEAFRAYEASLTEGVSREKARIVLPLNTYTEIIFSVDLLNLLKFLKLRHSKHAQEEIFQCAGVLEHIVESLWPWVHESYVRHWQNNITLTAQEAKILLESLRSGSTPETIMAKLRADHDTA